jgi:hypothetical protein
VVFKHFGTSSKTEIEQCMPLFDLTRFDLLDASAINLAHPLVGQGRQTNRSPSHAANQI